MGPFPFIPTVLPSHQIFHQNLRKYFSFCGCLGLPAQHKLIFPLSILKPGVSAHTVDHLSPCWITDRTPIVHQQGQQMEMVHLRVDTEGPNGLVCCVGLVEWHERSLGRPQLTYRTA